MTIPFRCQCGTLQGDIEPTAAYARAVCYCRDCQTYARALEREDVLNPAGGSDIVAMWPAGWRFSAGREQVACLSLSPKGLLRWHSACCNTPIANTPRNPKLPYAGVLAGCIAEAPGALDATVGPARIALNTGSARGEVAATPMRAALGLVRILWGMLRARLSGRHRTNPFFDVASGRPVAEPRVLTREERTAAAGG